MNEGLLNTIKGLALIGAVYAFTAVSIAASTPNLAVHTF